MIIEIKGVQFVNKGAELMLHAILSALKEQYPDAKIALKPNKNSPYEKRAALGCYQKIEGSKWRFLLKFLPKKIRNSIFQKWGLVTDLDIDLILDASGFAYGDQWGSKKLKKLASEIGYIKDQGGSYIFLPQALGPFSRAGDKQNLINSFGKADLICARESDSFSYVTDVLGESDNLKVYPDFTNLLKGKCPSYYSDGQKKVLIIPNNNMLSTKNDNEAWRENYLNFIKNSVFAIENLGLTPVFLNHGGEKDRNICISVNQELNQNIEIIDEDDPVFVKGIIGASTAVICSRFHGCVSALSQTTPCIGTSWSHKYEELFSEYDRSNFLLGSNSSQQDIENQLALFISKSDENYENYLQRIEVYKQQARNMWQDIFSITDKKHT